MKKSAILFTTIMLGLIIVFYQLGINQEAKASEYQRIPDEAIRLRILANSDQEDDQALKRLVRDRVNQEITQWVEALDSIEVARAVIQERLPEIEQVVRQTLAEAGEPIDFKVDYDSAVNFPAKVYGSYVYPAGEYESILITLGEGKGANWWCVLFPPLCFLDFSNGTTVATEHEEQPKEVEVKFFFLEWFR